MTDKYANLRARLAALKLGGPVSTDARAWNAATDALDVELVAELLAERDSMVQAQPAAVSDEQMRAIGHRTAWRFKHSSDPAHSDTYTFNDACLLTFARAILALRPPFDVEAMIQAVLPGGYSCDPQQVADAIRAYMALRPQAYPLPDDLYDSKDWRQGTYASRVEWLHTMYEHAKHERDEYAAQVDALRPQAVPMTEADTARLDWIAPHF